MFIASSVCRMSWSQQNRIELLFGFDKYFHGNNNVILVYLATSLAHSGAFYDYLNSNGINKNVILLQ